MNPTSIEQETRPLTSRWADRWSRFLQGHGGWWEKQLQHEEYVYAIPTPIIAELCNSGARGARRSKGQRFLFERDEQCEQAFTRLCRSWDQCIVGVNSSGHAIYYGYLATEVTQWQPDGNQADEVIDQIMRGVRNRHLAISQSQMVHVAMLIQQPCYWEGLRVLRSKWSELRKHEGLSLEDVNGCRVPFDAWLVDDQTEKNASPLEKDFRLALWGFANRWEIDCLLTWDLPVPKRPRLHVLEEQARLHFQRAFTVPSFIPLSRLDGDYATTWQQPVPQYITNGANREKVKGQRFIDPCEKLIHCFLCELAVRSRFGRSLPRGSKACLLNGLAHHLGIGFDQVKRMTANFQAAF